MCDLSGGLEGRSPPCWIIFTGFAGENGFPQRASTPARRGIEPARADCARKSPERFQQSAPVSLATAGTSVHAVALPQRLAPNCIPPPIYGIMFRNRKLGGPHGKVSGQRYPGAGGPRRGPDAAGHVHRLDGLPRPAPPDLGDRRQRHRRGDERLRHRDHRHAQKRRQLRGVGQRPRHPGGHPPATRRIGGGGGLHPAPRRRQV